ncbi:uncharacterized protein [Gossypium hirsutum]|uniref:Retrotransposon gag domain-containing protein n=1 Tax=Gossypium hirsutum TaxID=3635 RepID=A0ABM2YHW6_GOSHI|nr:uncharacterized protein LOC121203732 [Gossypium hirsutum]
MGLGLWEFFSDRSIGFRLTESSEGLFARFREQVILKRIKYNSTISIRGTRGRGTRGRDGGCGGAQVGSLALGHIPNNEAKEEPASPVTETGSHDCAAGDEATKRILDDLDCTPEQKLKGAVSLLRDEAYQWWLTVKKGTQPDQLTWEFFNNAFQGKYVGTSYVDAQRWEFLNLTQGDKYVAEYEAEFLRLSRYARGMVATEYECYVHLEDELRDNLRVLIAPQRERDFAMLVEKVKIAEDVKRAKHQNHEKVKVRNKRVWEPSSSAMGIRRRPSLMGRSELRPLLLLLDHSLVLIVEDAIKARGGNGLGRGRRALGRDIGHIEVSQSTLVYAVCCREDGDAPDIIMGTFFIHNVPYTALVDVGSTHSYIAYTVSEALGKIFLEDLMELPFGEFDLILGMDWLVNHQVSLDCATKWVILKTADVDEGCEAYLAYISVFDSEVFSVKDIRTIKDYSDVFPDKLPRLPPNREVEFGIKLLPGTAPLSIAPYRMTLKEFVELKA